MKPVQCFILLILLSFCSCRKKIEPVPSRSFLMGVTPWPADFTTEEVEKAYKFINEQCDFVSHHFDEGIPYEESFHNLNWPAELVNDINNRKQKTEPGKKILLSVSALNLTRLHKADYYRVPDGISDSIKNYWNALAVNDPKVIAAYVGYVSHLVDELQPQYVNFGVESNHAGWPAADFAKYKDFLFQVYAQLKAQYPGIPFFVSFMATAESSALSIASELIPCTDYIGLSAYPYIDINAPDESTDPSLLSNTLFTRYLDLAPSKPWGFAETAYGAEDLIIPVYSLNKTCTPAWQKDYLQMVCNLADQRKASFLVWFCSRDYDEANNRLRQLGLYQDLFGLWEDTGLLDENDMARPAYSVWTDWMKRDHK